MQKPKVGVALITYNHEKFIAQSIESALGQQTDFDFKIVIGEDYSTDGTLKICQEYAQRFPEKIYLIPPRGSNVRAVQNVKDCFDACRDCEYVILLEGDDYWTNPLKLQKQVDFLDKNPDFSMCFHNAEVVFEGNEKLNYYLNANIEKDIFTLNDLMGEDEIWFMATASILFREKFLNPLPDWFVKSKSGDIPMHILAARHGKIKYLDEVMSIYRKHDGGQSLTDHKDDEPFLKNRIFMYSMLDKETGFKFHEKVNKNIARYYRMLLDSKQFSGKYWKQLPVAMEYLKLAKPPKSIKKAIIRDYILPKSILNFSRNIKQILGIIPK